jgi:uncharacterized cupin superfamily protein
MLRTDQVMPMEVINHLNKHIDIILMTEQKTRQLLARNRTELKSNMWRKLTTSYRSYSPREECRHVLTGTRDMLLKIAIKSLLKHRKH